MSNEILYVLLPDYAAHEAVYLSQAIASDEFALKENPKYVNKVLAPTLEPVKSIRLSRIRLWRLSDKPLREVRL